MPATSLFDLTGRKVLVTGGASGIGRSCALALAGAGAAVAIVDLDAEVAEETVRRIREMGCESLFVRCDVSKSHEVQSMVDAVAATFGRVDIAVNSAGIFRAGTDEGYDENDWDRVIDVNLKGVWLCAQTVMRQMTRQSPPEGKIVNIASIGAHIACSNGAYDASKAGVVHLTRTLAARWGRYNINVNSVSPGYVGTAFRTHRSSEERQTLRAFTPLGHVQRCADIDGAVLFFASRASDYVTGQDLIVDGGHTLSTWMVPLERAVPPRVGPDAELTEQ